MKAYTTKGGYERRVVVNVFVEYVPFFKKKTGVSINVYELNQWVYINCCKLRALTDLNNNSNYTMFESLMED